MNTEHSPLNTTDPPSATDAILESISDGVFTIDSEWRVTSFNRAAEEITGIPREDAIGSHCADVFRSSLCGAECALRQTLECGTPIIGKSAYIITADGERVPISISTAVLRNAAGTVIGGVEVFRDLSELTALRQELSARWQLADLTSRSPAMRRIFEVLPSIAASTSTVLIEGATGTGKELIARALHNLSPRRHKPFVAVNCGALPDTLLESELFGYKAGAFTGANRDKPGRLALAEGGTLLLDEIGEITPALQVRLLRVLQERVYEPLGGTASIPLDVRIIAATNRNLQQQVADGEFREDLYYRVNVVKLELPPLSERKEDIPLLVDQFITRFNQLQRKFIKGIEPQALSLLMAHHWRGNVRELENVIEHAFILCQKGFIKLSHLPPELTGSHPATTAAQPDTPTSELRQARSTFDRHTILAALAEHNNNRTATARALGIHKTTLYRKMRELEITF